MRGRCRFLSFVVEDMESERCNMLHTPGGFFFSPRKGVIVLMKITYTKTMH